MRMIQLKFKSIASRILYTNYKYRIVNKHKNINNLLLLKLQNNIKQNILAYQIGKQNEKFNTDDTKQQLDFIGTFHISSLKI